MLAKPRATTSWRQPLSPGPTTQHIIAVKIVGGNSRHHVEQHIKTKFADQYALTRAPLNICWCEPFSRSSTAARTAGSRALVAGTTNAAARSPS